MASLGVSSQAAFEICRQAFVFFGTALFAFNPTTLTITSKYLGSSQLTEAKNVFFRCMTISFILGILNGILLLTFLNQIIALFTTDLEVVSKVVGGLWASGLFFTLDASSACVEGAMAANKQAKQLGFNSLISTVVATIVLLVVGRMQLASVASVMLVQRIIPLGRFCGNWGILFFNQESFKLQQVEDNKFLES
eukprot:TRINITY_DN46222_c0_g2_i2.p2 TRINITY_DN46222_c0_g2~~TRINITY_DN46222_c0_g2_i2.p2  ORF type:complete len:212 (-),score=24.15 TRINITY_DN46222_c0_g2_i2:165-746(-)